MTEEQREKRQHQHQVGYAYKDTNCHPELVKSSHVHSAHIDVLVQQLQSFQRRWTGKLSSDGHKVLPDAALKEIANLQVHMEKGCLSGTQ